MLPNASHELRVVLSGWAAKPMAMLLSSFREVILIDADVLFFVDPALLLSGVSATWSALLPRPLVGTRRPCRFHHRITPFAAFTEHPTVKSLVVGNESTYAGVWGGGR
jgi:hypothetical protein